MENNYYEYEQYIEWCFISFFVLSTKTLNEFLIKLFILYTVTFCIKSTKNRENKVHIVDIMSTANLKQYSDKHCITPI